MGMDVQEGVSVGLLSAVATKTISALVRVFGTRKERADADALEASHTERAADLALRMAETNRQERDTCHERLDELKEEHITLKQELTSVTHEMRICDERSLALTKQVAWMERALDGIYRGDTEPPPRMP